MSATLLSRVADPARLTLAWEEILAGAAAEQEANYLLSNTSEQDGIKSGSHLSAAIERVKPLMNLRTDSFLVLRQCADCWSNMTVIGQASPRPDTLYWAVM